MAPASEDSDHVVPVSPHSFVSEDSGHWGRLLPVCLLVCFLIFIVCVCFRGGGVPFGICVVLKHSRVS